MLRLIYRINIDFYIFVKKEQILAPRKFVSKRSKFWSLKIFLSSWYFRVNIVIYFGLVLALFISDLFYSIMYNLYISNIICSRIPSVLVLNRPNCLASLTTGSFPLSIAKKIYFFQVMFTNQTWEAVHSLGNCFNWSTKD